MPRTDVGRRDTKACKGTRDWLSGRALPPSQCRRQHVVAMASALRWGGDASAGWRVFDRWTEGGTPAPRAGAHAGHRICRSQRRLEGTIQATCAESSASSMSQSREWQGRDRSERATRTGKAPAGDCQSRPSDVMRPDLVQRIRAIVAWWAARAMSPATRTQDARESGAAFRLRGS